MAEPERLSPERAARLLRAKAAEMEGIVSSEMAGSMSRVDVFHTHRLVVQCIADIALVAQLLAEHIESAAHR